MIKVLLLLLLWLLLTLLYLQRHIKNVSFSKYLFTILKNYFSSYYFPPTVIVIVIIIKKFSTDIFSYLS